MYRLTWEGTYGYGDCIGAWANAGRIQNDFDKDVELTFNWYEDRPWFPPHKKYHVDDPESVLERCEGIAKHFQVDTNRITLKHARRDKWDDTISQRPRFINRYMELDWRGTTWKTAKQPYDGNYIAVWNYNKNVDNHQNDPRRRWKKPVDHDSLSKYFRYVSALSGMEVVEINYRLPMDECFDIIRGASFCIGYEGIGNLISKNYFKPIIVFSQPNGVVTNTSGPWHFRANNIEDAEDFENIIEDQYEQIDKYRSRCY
jgi:hypothetical protein